MARLRIPVRRERAEAAIEAFAHPVVGLALVAPAMDLEQLQVGQRTGAAGALHMADQQIDRRIVLAEHDEEVGLLLEVDQLLDTDLAARIVDRGDFVRPDRQGWPHRWRAAAASRSCGGGSGSSASRPGGG